MAKLNERKLRWITQQKLGETGSGDYAMIQRVSSRRVEQLCQAYRRTGILSTLKKPGRLSKGLVRLQDAALIWEVCDKLKVSALTLERVLKHTHGSSQFHNRIHMLLKDAGGALPRPSKQNRRN